MAADTDTIDQAQFPDLEFDDKGNINGSVKILQGYFGRLPGDNLAAFAQEIKKLTPLDKAQICQGIKDGTLNYN